MSLQFHDFLTFNKQFCLNSHIVISKNCSLTEVWKSSDISLYAFDQILVVTHRQTYRLGWTTEEHGDIHRKTLEANSERERKRDRQTDRQIDRQTDRQIDRQTDRQIDRQTDRQIDRQTDRQIDRQTDRQIDRQTNRQSDKQTDEQTGGHTEGHRGTDNRKRHMHTDK